MRSIDVNEKRELSDTEAAAFVGLVGPWGQGGPPPPLGFGKLHEKLVLSEEVVIHAG